MSFHDVIQQFQSASTQSIPLKAIQTRDALQPRVIRLIPIRDKGRAEESREQHIASLRLVLEATERNQLDPVWLAELDTAAPQGLSLIDGHHRLRAYAQAGRETIPAKVLRLDWNSAVIVSKLVNCTGRSLALHPEQCRDAAWQYLASITKRGTTGLPPGESLRSIAAKFSISKNTVSSMLSYLPDVTPTDFTSFAIDPGTDWPRWRYVREAKSDWHTNLPASHEEQLNRDAERVARQIMKIVDASSPAVRARALEMLANEEVQAANQLDSVELLAHFSPPPSPPSVPIGTPSVPSQLAHLDT